LLYSPTIHTAQQKSFPPRLHAKKITDILKRYKVTQIDPATGKSVNWHVGDTFEHSVWPEKAVEQWFDTNDEWVEGLNRTTATLAAFLHDIGKAGDLEFKYLWKEDHPEVGFNMLLDKANFYYVQSVDGHPFNVLKKSIYQTAPTLENPHPVIQLPDNALIREFNFSKWFQQQGITPDQQKIIAISVGIHYDFGLVLKQLSEGKSEEDIFKNFLDSLKKMCKHANYNNGILTEELVKMSIMIGAADLKGTDQVVYPSTTMDLPTVIEIPEGKIPLTGGGPYTWFGLEKKGKETRKKILEYFKNTYNKLYNT
jgi:hypothetical protein